MWLGLLSFAQPGHSIHDIDEASIVDSFVIEDPAVGFRTTYFLNSNSSFLDPATDSAQIPIQGLAKIIDIKIEGVTWAVHEDLAKRDGNVVFSSPDGKQEIFPKTGEATFWQESKKYSRNMGLNMSDVGMNLRDILADALLKNGEPIEEQVAAVIPPLGSLNPGLPGAPATWTSFVGNVQANDNMPIFGKQTFAPASLFALRSEPPLEWWFRPQSDSARFQLFVRC